MTTNDTCTHLVTNNFLSREFRARFEAHEASESDPARALQSARETVSENHPGDEFEFRDETLTVVQALGHGCGECARENGYDDSIDAAIANDTSDVNA